MLNKKREKVRR